MNQLRTWLLNPNVHLILSGILQILAFVPQAAPFAPILQTIGATLTGVGVILPETGSLHATDYANLANVAAKTVATVAANPVTVPTTGSLHATDYANIASAVVQAIAAQPTPSRS